MVNPVRWFEIAVQDMDRAAAFYKQVFETEFTPLEMGEDMLMMFPGGDAAGSGGALVKSKDNTPCTDGTIVYFTSKDVAVEAARIEDAGGKLIVPKTSIGEFGWIAQFIDTEGNRVGIHSQQG